MNEPAVLTVLIAMLGGAIRVSTPFMFVSLGECLTEKSGRVNLGLEGTLVLGAMVAYAASYHTGNPWIGVLAAGVAGSVLGAMHGSICGLPRVNDVAVGIAMMLFGVGGAFLSLSYPGSWNQGLSSGQGLMAVALVIFSRWDPLRCIAAALLFGAAGAIGPSLQSIGITQGYYFFNAAPYILTLGIMIATSSAKHSARDMPGELSIAK
jgi:general nucleoside transport system permease protein